MRWATTSSFVVFSFLFWGREVCGRAAPALEEWPAALEDIHAVGDEEDGCVRARGAGEVGGLEYGRGRLAARRRQFALDGSHEAYARRGWIPPSSIRGHGVRAPRP
ncbi:hypothetical protein B0H13DRAFT_2479683, partial [Mycena leptocephala]